MTTPVPPSVASDDASDAAVRILRADVADVAARAAAWQPEPDPSLLEAVERLSAMERGDG